MYRSDTKLMKTSKDLYRNGGGDSRSHESCSPKLDFVGVFEISLPVKRHKRSSRSDKPQENKVSVSPCLFIKKIVWSCMTVQFWGQNIRLETLGIFLVTLIRASIDIPFFPPLYTTESERHRLRQLGTTLINCALELCLAFDSLNHIQLIFQFEHWIVMLYIHGD